MTESQNEPTVKYGGPGRGWYVVRRVELDGYPQTVTLSGPYTSRAGAEAYVAEKRRVLVGYVHVPEPFERRISYETASWYTLVTVPAGWYPVTIDPDPRWASFAFVGYRGIVTKEHFVNRVFTSSSVHEPTENIGKERSCTAQPYRYSVAQAFAENPHWQLAPGWSVTSEPVASRTQPGETWTHWQLVRTQDDGDTTSTAGRQS